MKLYVNGQIIDPAFTPVSLVFDNDEQRKTFAEQLANMVPRDAIRIYTIYPQGTPVAEIEKFMDEAEKSVYNDPHH